MSSWKTMFGDEGENMYETDDKCNVHGHIRGDELCHERHNNNKNRSMGVLEVSVHYGKWRSSTGSE